LGLKINLSKLEIVVVGDVDNLEVLASILECRVAFLPMKYLGLPLGALYKNTYIWNGIVECCEVCMKTIREKEEARSCYVAYLILLYRF
jgi:hypothetical protein